MPRYARAVLGGTFDRLHVGHEALLSTAFHLGRTVAIGLTTQRFLAAHPKPDGRKIQSFNVRRRALVRWVGRRFPGRPFEIRALDDAFGRSVEPGVGVLVVSADTAGGGRAVNRERRRRGVPAVPIVVVPLVLADDLLPISSRRIRTGEVDRGGRRLAPLRVHLAVSDPRDLPWVRHAIRSVFPHARLLLPKNVVTGSANVPAHGLFISVARRARGGWSITEASDGIRLPVRRLGPSPPARRLEGLRSILTPNRSAARKSF